MKPRAPATVFALAGACLVLAGFSAGAATTSGGVVVIWGCVGRPGVSSGDYGQCSVPPVARSGVTATAADFAHDLTLKGGRVLAWGCHGKERGRQAVPRAGGAGGGNVKVVSALPCPRGYTPFQ